MEVFNRNDSRAQKIYGLIVCYLLIGLLVAVILGIVEAYRFLDSLDNVLPEIKYGQEQEQEHSR